MKLASKWRMKPINHLCRTDNIYAERIRIHLSTESTEVTHTSSMRPAHSKILYRLLERVSKYVVIPSNESSGSISGYKDRKYNSITRKRLE